MSDYIKQKPDMEILFGLKYLNASTTIFTNVLETSNSVIEEMIDVWERKFLKYITDHNPIEYILLDSYKSDFHKFAFTSKFDDLKFFFGNIDNFYNKGMKYVYITELYEINGWFNISYFFTNEIDS